MRTLFVLLLSFSICHAAPVDKHIQRTSEFGDEGKFGGGDPGNTNALILWPQDSASIVRRHRPGGHSETTPKAVKLWSERGAGGFPVNLKDGNGFCSFLSRIDREPDLHACICDDTGAWDTGASFSCTPALTLVQCSPPECFTGTPPVTPPPANTCSVTDWSPRTSTVCAGDTFDQTRTLDDCSTETRTATGIKQCTTSCSVTDWSPDADTVCRGNSFTQSRTLSDCSTDTRAATGSKNCSRCTVRDWSPDRSSVCTGNTFTQSRIESDCSTSTRRATGTKDCTLPTCRWVTGPWSGAGPASICRGESGGQTRTVTLVNSNCQGGTAPAARRTVSGSKDCTPPCSYRAGSWSPSASNYCNDETFTQTRSVTSSPANCTPGNAPASSRQVSGTRNCEPPVVEPPDPPAPPPPSCTYWTTRQSTGGFLGVLCVPMKRCNGVTTPAGAAYPPPC